MSSLGPVPPDFQLGPTDLPTPTVPRANFVDIGAQIQTGMETAKKALAGAPGWLDWIGAIVGLILGTILGWIARIISSLISVWFQMWKTAEPGTDAVSASAINGLFGVNQSPSLYLDPTAAEGRAGVHSSVAQTIINGLFPGATSGSTASIQPGHAAVDNFVNLSARIAVEGWLQGWVFELASAGQVETFAELKDIIERTFGLGRLMRRVLAAPMKILLADPFTWELNQKYHPTLLAPGEVIRQYLRGSIDRTALQAQMDLHGYTSDKVDALINLNKLHLSAGQLLNLELHSSRTQADTISALQAQGYDADTAPLVRFVELQTRLDSWNLKIIDELSSAVAARKVDVSVLDEFMKESGIPALEAGLIRILTDNRTAHNRTFFSIAEGAQLVKKGIWSLDQFRTLATQHGYNSSDETDLELLVLLEIKTASDAAAAKAAAVKAKAQAAQDKATAAQAKATAAQAAALGKGVSLSAYQSLVTDGIRSIADYSAFLTSKGISSDNVAALTTVLRNKLDKAAAAGAIAGAAAATAKAKGLSTSQLETAVKLGVISIDEYESRLVAAGVSEDDAATLREVLQDQLDAAKTKADALAATKATAAVKHVNLTEEQQAVRLGLATIGDYSAYLTAQGFADDDVALLVAEISAQVQTDADGRAIKAANSPAGTPKGLTLAQTEKAVRAGLSPISDYQAALAAQGYDADAQGTLVNLLQLQMTQDADTLAAQGRASALVGQKGVSLTDLARAVKLGVVPISVYTDALSRSGVDDDDAQILTLTLAAQIKTVKVTVASQATVTKTLSAAGLSLATLESDVLAGKLTVSQLGQTLTTAGVDPDQVTSIVGLVQDELDTAAATGNLIHDATQRAAAKGLNLSQAAAAVKAGVKTPADFAVFAASLGYDPADVATLQATLLAALGKAAAKATASASSAKSPVPGQTAP